MIGKRIFITTAAAFVAAAVLSGCGTKDTRDDSYAANVADIPESARLSAAEYKERLFEIYRSWVKEVTYITSALFVEELGDDIPEVPACAARAREALRSLGEMLPPKSLDKFHNDILSGASVERKWLDAAERAAEAKQNGDTDAFSAAEEEIQKYADESGFPNAIIVMIKELNKSS